MSLFRLHCLALIGSACALLGANASAAPVDCEALGKIDYNKTFEVEPGDIDQCIKRGWDPPVSWRPNEGRSAVTAAGAGGITLGTRQSPQNSAGARGMPASVSSGMFNFSLKIPPWRGFPCQVPGGIDMCGGGSGDGTGTGGGTGTGTGTGSGSACPVASDTSGTYGEQQTVAASTSKALTCGGTVPLSTYLMGGDSSPTGIIATEAGNRTVWVYRANGNGFALQGTLQLPTKTCATSDPDSAEPLQLPIAQIIAFNGSTASIALRLQMEDGDVADPFDPDPDSQAKYFVVPTPGGNPQISGSCPRTSQFVRNAIALTAPITIESSTTPGCEGGPSVCGSLPENPTTPSNCDAVTTNPAGASCEGTTLFAVLNRPNMLFPPGSTATFTSMEGRTAHLVGSTGGSRLYAQPDTIMYFGARGGSFTLPEGGTLKLDNGTMLVMSGPATINAASRQVVMSAGGIIIGSDASTLQEFPANTSYAPNATLPFAVKVGRSVEIPAGLKLPTQPSPFVRLPVKVQ